jgi:hypothetical protein
VKDRAPKRAKRGAKAGRSRYLPPFVTPQLATLVEEPPRTGN